MSEEEKKETVYFRRFPDFKNRFQWKKADLIGSGGFGKVYKAMMKY